VVDSRLRVPRHLKGGRGVPNPKMSMISPVDRGLPLPSPEFSTIRPADRGAPNPKISTIRPGETEIEAETGAEAHRSGR